MNVLEANLLNSSMQGLAGTLSRNRERDDEMKLRREMAAQQAQETALARAMREKEFGARERDMQENRRVQAENSANLKAHRELVAQIQRESKEMQDRHYQQMEAAGLIDKLSDGLAKGTIKLDTFKAQFANNPVLKRLGLSVEMFQAPEKEPKGEFETQATHNLKKVEEYLRRANEAEATGQIEDAKRFREYATLLKSSVGKQDALGGTPATDGGASPQPMTLEEAMRKSKVDPIQSELDDHLLNISKGDMSYGFLNTSDRAARVRELEPKIHSLTNQAPAAVTGALNPPMAAPRTNIVPDKVSGTQQFESVGQARELGKKTGDIILLWDAAQKKYRRFQLD